MKNSFLADAILPGKLTCQKGVYIVIQKVTVLCAEVWVFKYSNRTIDGISLRFSGVSRIATPGGLCGTNKLVIQGITFCGFGVST